MHAGCGGTTQSYERDAREGENSDAIAVGRRGSKSGGQDKEPLMRVDTWMAVGEMRER